MASLPIIPDSWRSQDQPPTRSAAENTNDEPSPDSLAQSPVLVHTPEPSAEPKVPPESAPEPPAEEVERCWICQCDASEDEGPTEWRHPCSCTLTAHNECLLEWVASEEAPKNGDLGCRYFSKA